MILIRVMVACGLLISTVALADEGFGRLFTTPAERANLDYLRKITKDVNAKEKQEQVNVVPTEVVEDEIPEAPAPISMQGFVKRSDGKKGTVWINHQAVQENTANSSFNTGSINQKKSGQHYFAIFKKTLLLKPGQTYIQDDGSRSDSNISKNSLEN